MSQSKITLIGVENYLNPDHSVFETMQLPEGIDKDTLIGAIILRCQEFELLYSDPDFLTAAVNIWSRKNYRTFDKWVKALDIQYDPLYNYDRTEEYTDTHAGKFGTLKIENEYGNNSGTSDYTRTDNLSQSDDHTRTDNLSQSDDHTRTDNLTMTNNLSDTNDVTLTHSEKAYNDSTYVGTTQDVTDQNESHTGTVTNTGTQRTAGTTSNTGTQRTAGTTSNTGTQRNAGSDTGNFSTNTSGTENGTDDYTNIHKARLFGNIGVTTSQQMLQSELDIARWNMYEHIADLFAQEFCIMVY